MRTTSVKSIAASLTIVTVLSVTPLLAATTARQPRQRTTTTAVRRPAESWAATFAKFLTRMFGGAAVNAEPSIPLPGPSADVSAEPSIPLPITTT